MTEPHHIFAGLHVLLVSDDSHRVNSLLASLREREARAFDMGAPRDDASALMAADLIVVDTRAEAGFADTIRALEGDVRARWAPLVRVDYASILPGDGSVHLKTLAELCLPSLAPERELTERTRRDTTIETGLAPLGPTRLLRALAKAGPALYVAISSDGLKVEIELANELLVSAKADAAGVRFDAWSALTKLLPLDKGTVLVERRPFPAGMNIMEPLGQALEVAAQEYLCGEDKRVRAATDAKSPAQKAEPSRSESLGRGQRTLIGIMAPASLNREEKPFVPARPPRPSLPTSPRTEPIHALAKADQAAEPSMIVAPDVVSGEATPPIDAADLAPAQAASAPVEAPAPSTIEVSPEPTVQPRYEHRTGSSYSRSAPMTLIGFKAPVAEAAVPVIVQPEAPRDTSESSERSSEAPAEKPEPETDLRSTLTFERSDAPATADDEPAAEPPAAEPKAAPATARKGVAEEASIVIDETALGKPEVSERLPLVDERPTLEDVEPQEGGVDEDDESLGADAPSKTGEAAIDTDRIGGEADQETVRLDAGAGDSDEPPPSEDTWVGQKVPATAPAQERPAQRGKLWPLLLAAGVIGGLYLATQRKVEVSELPATGATSDTSALDKLAPNEPAPAPSEQVAPEPAAVDAPEDPAAAEPAVAAPVVPAEPEPAEPEPAPALAKPEPAKPEPARPEPAKSTPPAEVAASPAGQKSIAALEHEGLVFLMHHSRPTAAKAKPIFEEIVARDPLNPHGQAGLAQALLTLGDAPAAKPYIEEAIKLRGRRARYRVIYGDVLAALGKPEEARTSWQRAVELDPRDAEAQARTRTSP